MPLTPKQMTFSFKERLMQAAFVVLVVLVSLAVYYVQGSSRQVAVESKPVGIMGTSCTLRVTCEQRKVQEAQKLLKLAEDELRRCETLTSTWIETSEISRLNRAKSGDTIPLSTFTSEFLRLSKADYERTHGAFDITCGKLWLRWELAQKENKLPTDEEIQTLLERSNWSKIEIQEKFARKSSDDFAVVTGGSAKGLAIDRALGILRNSPDIVTSALVEVGGDIAVWHNSTPIAIRGSSDTLELADGAVCTSGHDVRFFTIQGQRYSQILDPRTGRPVSASHTVTVVAPDAHTADVWATALEVLGPAGLEFLPEGVTAEFRDTSAPSPIH